MKVKKRMFLKTVIVLLVAFILGLLFFYLLPYLKFRRLMKAEIKEEEQRKVHLLSETDHYALLEACRELSKKVSEGKLEPSGYAIRYESHPDKSLFPQIILDIEPTFISLQSDGRVIVEMIGGYHHYGVIAYPVNFEKPSEHFKYGDKKIIDGLWYYEDGYEGNPRYQKKIEKLIQKGKTRQIEKNTASVNDGNNDP